MGVSIEDMAEVSRARFDRRRRHRQPLLRWAMFRLVSLWVPIAAVLALALWNTLFLTLAPWSHRDNGPPLLDALPSQLLFAALLVFAGRVETARWRGNDESLTSVRIYWGLLALLIGLGVAALLSIPRPVSQ